MEIRIEASQNCFIPLPGVVTHSTTCDPETLSSQTFVSAEKGMIVKK